MQIVRSELEVPPQLSRPSVERDDAVRVEVVAGAVVAVPIRSGIAGPPIDDVQIGIVGPRDPRRRGATFQLSPSQVSWPFSPGPGTVQKRQARAPLFAS